MQKKSIPSSLAGFLTAKGQQQLAEDGLSDLAGLVRVFRESAPSKDSNPFSQENLTYLTALLDTIGVMDERLYEHYRALIDLFREGIFRAPRKELLAYPSWTALREKAVHLGLLPMELYGQNRPMPHVGVPETYLQIKEGKRK